MARRMKGSDISWDDWLIVFSLVFTYLTAIFMIVAAAQGDLAEHMTITAEGPVIDSKFIMFLKMLYGIQLTQTLAVGPTKISVLLFYRRIFRGKYFNIITWILIGLMTGWTAAFLFANMFECVPISESFKNAPGLGTNPKCIHTVPMYMAQVYTDVIMDVLILIVPLPLVWKLQLPTKQKLAVSGMFLLGLITTASSCAKMIVFYLVAAEMAAVPDLSYFMTPVIYWPLIEMTLQIVAACLPLLRPLVISWFGNHENKSQKSWPVRSSYTGLTGEHELGNVATSRSIRADDFASKIIAGYGPDGSKPHPQKIYVQHSFKTDVDSTLAV